MQKFHPKVKERLEESEITSDLYLIEWFFTLFGRAFDIDIVSKIWDYLLLFGVEFVSYKIALTLFSLMESSIVRSKSTDTLLSTIKEYSGIVEPNLLFKAFSKHKLQSDEFIKFLSENLDNFYIEKKKCLI